MAIFTKRSLLILSSALWSFVALPVMAQGLEEITVTARRVEESLQDVPVTVSAFTGDSLEAKGLDDISELEDLTPGLEINAASAISGSSSATGIFIRGIGISDFLLTDEAGVGVYVDDVYVSRSIGGLLGLVDIERVEVLKGPQGTLFGRNSVGGAISIITKDPTEEVGGRVGVTVGSDDRLDLSGKLNLPLTDNLFSSISFSSRSQDGYGIRLPFAGYTPLSFDPSQVPDAFIAENGLYGNGEALGNVNNQAIRAKLFYDGENFQARLAVDGSRGRENGAATTLVGIFAPVVGPDGPDAPLVTNAGFGGLYNFFVADPANGAPFYSEQFITGDPHRTFSNAPQRSNYDVAGIGLTLNWTWGPVDVKTITSYREVEAEFGRDGDLSPLVLDHTQNTYEVDQFTQEIQFTGTAFDDRLSWLIGGYYFEEDGSDRVQVTLAFENQLRTPGSAGLGDPNFPAPVPAPINEGFLDEINDVENESQAIFAQATYNFTDKLSATLGIRRTEDTKRYTPLHVTQGIAPVVLLSSDDRVEFSDTSPRFSLEYRWNETVFTYLSYSEAFKSGGFTGRSGPGDRFTAGRPFDPEQAEALEFGFKIDFERVRINGAIFATDYVNQQVTQTLAGDIAPSTQNAGESEINGFEVEVFAQPTDNLSLVFGYSNIDAKYTALEPGTAVSLTDEFINTPENTFNVAGDYTFDLNSGASIVLRADYGWKDDAHQDPQNEITLLQEAYGVLNVSASYISSEDWRVTAGVKNATDEIFLNGGFVQPGIGQIEGTFSRGRQAFLRADYSF